MISTIIYKCNLLDKKYDLVTHLVILYSRCSQLVKCLESEEQMDLVTAEETFGKKTLTSFLEMT